MTEAHAALLKDIIEQMLTEWEQLTQEQARIKFRRRLRAALAAETVPPRESPDLDDNGHPMDGN